MRRGEHIAIAPIQEPNRATCGRYDVGGLCMMGNDYRNLKIGELRAELQRLDDLARSTCSPDTKRRLLPVSRRRIHDLTALLLSPALTEICS
jgi:hypothetical protein